MMAKITNKELVQLFREGWRMNGLANNYGVTFLRVERAIRAALTNIGGKR